jgi:hypothetical protein
MDEISKDSLDYNLVFSYNDKIFKANSYYQINVKKYLPKFDFANTAGISKIEIIVPYSVLETIKLYYNHFQTNKHIIKYQDIAYINFEETKKNYEKLPDDLKWGTKMLNERGTSVIGVYTKFLPLFPYFYCLYVSSEIYDKSNKEYKFYTKLTDSENGNTGKNILLIL